MIRDGYAFWVNFKNIDFIKTSTPPPFFIHIHQSSPTYCYGFPPLSTTTSDFNISQPTLPFLYTPPHTPPTFLKTFPPLINLITIILFFQTINYVYVNIDWQSLGIEEYSISGGV